MNWWTNSGTMIEKLTSSALLYEFSQDTVKECLFPENWYAQKYLLALFILSVLIIWINFGAFAHSFRNCKGITILKAIFQPE